MPKPFQGKINLDIRDSVPDWDAFLPDRAPGGAPNVLVVLYDDTGCAAWSPYGGRIEMPTLQRFADNGLTFIGIGVSLTLLLYRASRPNVAVLGRLPDGNWVDVARSGATPREDVVVLRVEAGLFFANAEHVRRTIVTHARADGVRAVVVDAETVPYIDVTAAQMLKALREDLGRDGIRLLLAHDIGQVRDVLRRAGDEDAGVFPTVEEAVSRAR